MARKTRRKMMAKIALTNEAYKQVEEAAFKNCRTVNQELTFIVEQQLSKPQTKVWKSEPAYDAPIPEKYGPEDSKAPVDSIPTDSIWTQEQETDAYLLGKERGLSEAQVTTLKLIHKTQEATMEAIRSEAVSA